MKKYLFLLSITVALILMGAGCNNTSNQIQLTQEQKAAEFNLQSKCADAALKSFKENNYSADYSYINHYNTKLNKCFILIHYWNIDPNSGIDNTMDYLSDVFESKLYADINTYNNHLNIGCEIFSTSSLSVVNTTHCKTQEEFDNYINQFMNE